jgi:hypothetical protein
MIGLVLAAALLVPSADAAADLRWERVCPGSAKAEDGSEVDVFIHMGLDGSPPTQNATWTPPKRARTKADAGLAGDAPSLQITYEEVAHGRLGRPTGMTVSASARVPALLDKAQVALALDGGPGSTVDLVSPYGDDPAFDHPLALREGWISDTDDEADAPNGHVLIADSETARMVLATLLAGDGRTLGSTRYDVSDRTARNRLFIKAWLKAARAARRPRRCAKIPVPVVPLIFLVPPISVSIPVSAAKSQR